MKKILYLFGFLSMASMCSILIVTGQATRNLSQEYKYTLDNSNISFTLSNIWKEENNTSHDLSLSKLNSNLHLSVYKKSEINMTAEELLNSKIKEELNEHDTKVLVKKYNTNKTKNRIIYSKLYTATKDNVEEQYLFSVVEFDNSDTYVFSVYTAKGAYMQYSIDDIQRLLIKMEWNGPALTPKNEWKEKTQLAYN